MWSRSSSRPAGTRVPGGADPGRRPRPWSPVAQDRIREKQFLVESGFPVAPYAVVAAADADPDVTYPAILKTARLGYDGKGQRTVGDGSTMRAAWRLLGSVPCVLEQRVGLETEVSVVVARTAGGDVAAFPVAENTHVDGILDLTVVPAAVSRRSPTGRRSWPSPTPSIMWACWRSRCSSSTAT